jgi:hypothetical protein
MRSAIDKLAIDTKNPSEPTSVSWKFGGGGSPALTFGAAAPDYEGLRKAPKQNKWMRPVEEIMSELSAFVPEKVDDD